VEREIKRGKLISERNKGRKDILSKGRKADTIERKEGRKDIVSMVMLQCGSPSNGFIAVLRWTGE
jgi:hypothetical protein